MKLRLRSVFSKAEPNEERSADSLSTGPLIVDGSGKLRDYIIFVVRESTGVEQIRAFRRHVQNLFGDKTLVINADVDICVFEEVVEPTDG